MQKDIQIGNTVVAAEIVDTDALRQQGLSGRAGLAAGEGMLFVFDTDNTWGIWMKDMRFAIDIVWADSAGTVVTVAARVAPESYPEVFYPAAPVRYVLELPAGFAAEYGIAEGVKLVI